MSTLLQRRDSQNLASMVQNIRSAQRSKEGHRDYVAKDIAEIPIAVEKCLRGRCRKGEVALCGLSEEIYGFPMIEHMAKASRIIMFGSGSSYNAAMAGKYFIEAFGRVTVQVEYSAEYRSQPPPTTSTQQASVVIAISQSGETGDTLAAVKVAKDLGLPVFGLCNVPNSPLSRETDSGAYLRAGE